MSEPRPDSAPAPAPAAEAAAVVVDPRPLLLLDVDGVLLIAPTMEELEDDTDREPRIPPEARSWLVDLADEFELCWATTWEDLANSVLAPQLGLPPLPAIRFEMDHRARTAKLRSVIDFVGDRPMAWIDDDLHEDAFTWAAGRRAPTLLVPCDMTEGMARRHVDRLLAFAAELAHDSERRRA